MAVSIVPVGGKPNAAVAAVVTAGGVAPDSESPIRVNRFLGTAFLLHGYSVHFATAKHVLALANPGELVSLVLDAPNGLRQLGVERIQDTAVDVTVGTLSCPYDVELPGFAITDRMILNSDVCSFEHSNSGRQAAEGLTWDPRFRKGYVIGSEASDHGHTAGCQAIEVSYPALKGASGAPVFWERALDVVGLMVENVDRELLPTQLLRTVDDEGNLIEEIRYAMPHGRAIGFSTLNALLDPYHVPPADS